MWTIIVSVLGAISAALVSLALWRYQLIAKRRYEIAEQIYGTALDNLDFLNATLYYIKNVDPVSPDMKSVAEKCRQLQDKNRELFIAVERTCRVCRIHFGDSSATPFDELAGCHGFIMGAIWQMQQQPYDKSALARACQDLAGPSVIRGNIDKTIAEIERLCLPHLRPHWITLLLPFVTPEHIAWCRGKVRYACNRVMGRT